VTAPCALTWQGASPMPATSLIGTGEPSFMAVSAPNHDLTGTTRPNKPAIGALE
jgi:hypothetical protein